ncbi:hypothetical protein [Pedobacter sp. Hv1]|uniref:hypothetical protein n=1 Tax=Pedobacter sp. Hv1 TaxID=1740090 RepID=UPI00128F5A63|nr:hypothetical protein [Pedobacter sp. Hv1]
MTTSVLAMGISLIGAFSTDSSARTSSGTGGGGLGPDWQTNKKMASIQKIAGSHTEYRYVSLGGPMGGYYYPVTINDYKTISCCIQATDSDACNMAAQSSSC